MAGWRMAAIGALACLALGGGAPARAVEIRIGGSGAALPLMKDLLDAHRRAAGGTVASFASAGGPGALAALRDGVIDIAVTAREPPRELASHGFRTVEFMRSPLVFVTSQSNPAISVSRPEVESSYAGPGRWPDGSVVRTVLRPRADTDTILVRSLSPAVSAAVDRAFAREGLHWAATDDEALAAAERIPGSLAPSTLVLVRKAGYRVKVLALDEVEATQRSLGNGSYPLLKSFWITVRQPARPDVESFISFLASRKARAIICESGGVPWPSPCN